MFAIPGYEIHEKIYESDNTLVCRALQQNHHHVILKILKEDFPTPEEIVRFKQEYEATRSLNLKGVVKPHGLEKYENTIFIVFEDIGAKSLDRFIADRELSLREFLTIAIKIVKNLDEIHAHHITHKNINPSNIIFNPETGQLQIIDFGISTAMPQESLLLKNPKVIESNLAYISPEQAGRMNRTIDYRADFYSLGATFYELLLCRPPFISKDPLEIIHCHMAKRPEALHEVNPEIPGAVSDIVMKLLEKSAEDRYQSASGIKTDLEECLNQLNLHDQISSFPLAHKDVSDRFQIPQKLYGRNHEINTLKAAFKRVISGENELMLVSGYSGVGKTALVQEMYGPAIHHCGHFISGKYDQFQRNIPYSGLIQAFQELIRQFLTESEAKLDNWRKKLLLALGSNGQLMIDVIPELELIIGAQRPVADLPPAETQNRFYLTFQNFIQVFIEPQHPLVLFLDDLQSADRDSLRLVKLIVTNAESRGFFFIGAYRDNEINKTHPLKLVLDKMQKAGRIVNHISLMPLALPQVNQLVSDTLNCDPKKSLSLAELVFSKTNGNPFFVSEFLKTIHKKNLIEFDHEHLEWKWSTSRIHALNITDNVVELVANKIQNLMGDLHQVLKLAACIGNRFELKTLSLVCGKAQRETAIALREALAQGFILPIGDAYKSIEFDLPEPAGGLTVEYRFSHDRIQQAVYSLIPENERSSVHLKMGRQLLEETPPDKLTHKIFDITNQFNHGVELIYQDAERYKLAQLNLVAGKKAKAAAAYEHAFKYLKMGIKILTSQPSHSLNETGRKGTFWQTHYELALELHVETAAAAYLCADFDKMEQLLQVVFDQTQTLLDKVKAYEIKIQAFYAQNKMLEAVNTAMTALKLLGVNFPDHPGKLSIMLAFMRTKFALAGKNVEDLGSLAQMTDPNMQAALHIIVSSVLPAHYSAPKLFPLFVFKSINLALKYGASPVVTFAFAGYGLILCGVIGDTESGYKFGKLALDLLEDPTAKGFKAKTLVSVNSFITHWKKHLRETLPPLLEAYQCGLETGDPEFAAISLSCHSRHSYFAGRELAVLEREAASFWNNINRLKQKTALNYLSVIRQVILNLMGKTEKPYRLVGECYNEETMLPIHMAANDNAAIFIVHLHKTILNYLFYRFDDAVENIIVSETYIDGVKGRPHVPIFYFYDSLTKLAVFPDVQESRQKQILKKIAANQKKMKKWADHAPMNFLHKFYLVEAERCRIVGKDTKAIEFYNQAVRLAQKHEYINEKALANELAARFYLEKEEDKLAGKYMTDARYCYNRWGAVAKVEDLDTRYSKLFNRIDSDAKTSHVEPQPSADMTVMSPEQRFDLVTIMKITRAISSEIVMPRLLARLIRIIIENAGAERGVLILKSQGQLLIEAEGSIEQDDIKVLHSLPVEEAGNLPQRIINYVDRTHEYVVINNHKQDNIFANDIYILKHQPKSILCGPLLYKSEFIGILYIENSILPEAFSGRRSDVLRILSSQIAVSLENAKLYKEMEAKTKEIKAININLNSEIEQRKKAEKELTEYRDHLEELIEQRTKELKKSRQALANLERDIEKRYHFQNLVGKNEKMQEIYALIEDLTDVPSTVLITGESGTGKELVAEALHYGGKRKDKPFVKVNCSALSETILESELFGHVKGAFTGADRDNVGRFQRAGEGTIFLDEIGDISPYFQKRLLRVIQEREFEQVGDTMTKVMKARILAATNQDLLAKVKQGEFRKDLYYRLRVVELSLPPLRDRKEDIPLLLHHFLRYFNDKLNKEIVNVYEDVLKQFMAYSWPGNIRELKNTLEHICILCKDSSITVDDLPADFANLSRPETSFGAADAADTSQTILSALEEAKWNKTLAAHLLGISRRTLYRKIKESNLIENIKTR